MPWLSAELVQNFKSTFRNVREKKKSNVIFFFSEMMDPENEEEGEEGEKKHGKIVYQYETVTKNLPMQYREGF